MAVDPLSAAVVLSALGYLVAPRAWRAFTEWADRSAETDAVVQLAAAELRLERRGATRHTGKVDGVLLELVTELQPVPESSEVRSSGRLRIAAADALPLPVRLCAEGPLTWLGAQDVQFGEQRFDEAVHVLTQDDAVARALLDGATRDLTIAAVEQGMRFENGVWSLEQVVTGWTTGEVIAATRRVARTQRAFADAAARVADLPAALRGVARGDRHAGVRARTLDLLVHRGLADHETLSDRCRDVDVNVRLIAARTLGADGADTLLDAVRNGSRTVRVRAASALGEARQLRPELVQEVEECLVGALDDPDLLRLALLGLARTGTSRSVEPLKRVARQGPTAELRGMARQVLEAVRARLDPTASGGLSLVPLEGGELSEARSSPAEGALSVTPPRPDA